MAEEVAIRVEGVYKDFVLPHEKANSVKSIFTSLYKNKDKSVDVQHALKNINFEIKKGEFFGIVGRNGSGKSTLLKILAGIYQPTEGSVTTRGRLVPFIELGVGFNPELTGRENVYLNGAMLGFSKKQIEGMYENIVAFAELEDFMDQKLKNYSSGMQVRLAFSMATRAEADILLVDEVLAVGDAEFQRKCFNYFRKLKKQKKTVVFVSHDMGAIREYCDRAIMIEKSEIVKEGKVNQVANAYTRLFMESSPQQPSQDNDEEKPKRYGTLDAEFISVESRQDEYVDFSPIFIDCTLRANINVEDLVLGFSIKNQADTQLLGVNTKLLQKKLPNMKAGDSIRFTWVIPNVLNDGTYYIDVAAHTADGDNYDWWEEAAVLTVYKEIKTSYVVVPEVDFTTRKA